MGILHPAMGKEQTKMIKAILIASLATVALAEAEADPYVYSGLGGYYGGHLGYTGLGHLGYGYGLGYGHRLVYGKRSADAEPEARPRLILTTDTDTVLDTLDTILDTLDTVDSDTVDTLDTIDSDTMVVSDTTARGLLMLRPIPMFTTDTDWDTSDMLDTSDTDTDTDTAMDTCTARGLLMLSLRLRPIPTFSTVDSDTPD